MLRGIKDSVCEVYSPEPCADVYSLQLNLKISKLAYCNVHALITLLSLAFLSHSRSSLVNPKILFHPYHLIAFM